MHEAQGSDFCKIKPRGSANMEPDLFRKNLTDERKIESYFHPTKNTPEKQNKTKQNKTSMMWPSQNFLLYIGTVIKIKVNKWINN